VGGHVVDPVGDHLAQRLVLEVVNLHTTRIALRTIVAPAVLELADQLVSRPAGFRRQPLVERCVRLSPHTAPIRRTRRSYRYASGRRGRGGSEPASQGSGQPQPYVLGSA